MEPRFVQAGHARLQYFEHGDGPETLVLVHGFTASGRIWAKLQRAMAPSFRTIAISNRGAGDSDRGRSADDYTVQAFARDLHAAVSALALDRFTLVGHSLGAATATQCALDHPEMLRALVLLNPVPLDAGGWRPGWQDGLRALFESGLRPAINQSEPAMDPALQGDMQRNPIERRDGGIESMATLRLRGRLGELPMPVLVVGGDRDDLVGVHNILAEYLALPVERRSLQIFHSVGHSPNLEVPERLAGTLRRFLSGLT